MPAHFCHLIFQLQVKVEDFQKKIDIIYRLKQICRFTILNSSFEFSRVFCSLAASLSINLETEKQNVISKLKFKIVFWHIFLSPIEFSEKKRPLVYNRNRGIVNRGFGLGNRNQGQISVLVVKLKIFLQIFLKLKI